MNYDCNRNTTLINMTSKRFHPSVCPQLKIKFNFLFKSDYLNIFENKDSTKQLFLEDLPSSTDYTSATVAVEESLPLEDIVEAIVEAVGDRLVHEDEDLVELVDLAWEEVNKSFPTKTLPMFSILYLRFEIRIEHMHVYVVENDYFRKILAADSSFAQLKKCEVVRVKEEEEERCCCICWEKLHGSGCGGGAMRMPCSHVFHGGCIKGWLATSHSCPICRYKMPTE